MLMRSPYHVRVCLVWCLFLLQALLVGRLLLTYMCTAHAVQLEPFLRRVCLPADAQGVGAADMRARIAQLLCVRGQQGYEQPASHPGEVRAAQVQVCLSHPPAQPPARGHFCRQPMTRCRLSCIAAW